MRLQVTGTVGRAWLGVPLYRRLMFICEIYSADRRGFFFFLSMIFDDLLCNNVGTYVSCLCMYACRYMYTRILFQINTAIM